MGNDFYIADQKRTKSQQRSLGKEKTVTRKISRMERGETKPNIPNKDLEQRNSFYVDLL